MERRPGFNLFRGGPFSATRAAKRLARGAERAAGEADKLRRDHEARRSGAKRGAWIAGPASGDRSRQQRGEGGAPRDQNRALKRAPDALERHSKRHSDTQAAIQMQSAKYKLFTSFHRPTSHS